MSLKLRNWIKFVLRFENFAIFKQNYTLKVFIAFKMAHSWCFILGENQDFIDILQKKFYNINKGSHSFFSSTARQLLNCPPFQKLSFKCSPFFPQIPSTFCVCSNHIRFWHLVIHYFKILNGILYSTNKEILNGVIGHSNSK